MIFIKDVPELSIITEKGIIEIKSVTSFQEYEDRVVIKFVEYASSIVRGLICDMGVVFSTTDNSKLVNYVIQNLLLVYVSKSINMDGFTEFRYVFFK